MPESKLPLTTPLSEVKRHLREHYHEGVECPACSQLVRLYRRPLTSSMCFVLILIYKALPTPGWLHVESYLRQSVAGKSLRGDFHKLRLWGLIEAKEEKHDNGSPRNGFYRITLSGIAFVKGQIDVPEHVLIYNNKVRGYGVTKINIRQAMKNKFDYNELMQAI